MIARVTRSQMSSFKLKIKSPLRIFVGYSLVTYWLFVIIKHFQAVVLNKSSVLHKRILIGHSHLSQFMEKHNLGVKTLYPDLSAQNTFLKLPENQITTNLIFLTSSNFVTISHINHCNQGES